MPKAALNIVKSASKQTTIPRLFVLEINAGKIHVMNTDGSDRETIVTDCHLPDGIVVDVEAGHIYWTNMGVPNLNDGSVERADLDGKNRKVIVPIGDTHTPKQIILDKKAGKLYWCDREGMRVMGSFAAQRYVIDHSHEIDGLILSGSGALDRLARIALLAPLGSNLLNAAFEPARTPFDWLSRDQAIVEAFMPRLQA